MRPRDRRQQSRPEAWPPQRRIAWQQRRVQPPLVGEKTARFVLHRRRRPPALRRAAAALSSCSISLAAMGRTRGRRRQRWIRAGCPSCCALASCRHKIRTAGAEPYSHTPGCGCACVAVVGVQCRWTVLHDHVAREHLPCQLLRHTRHFPKPRTRTHTSPQRTLPPTHIV